MEGKIFIIEQEIERRSRVYEDAIALWIFETGRNMPWAQGVGASPVHFWRWLH